MDFGDFSQLDEYVTDVTNDGLKFKLVEKAEDLESEEGYFDPEMTHQIYGKNENIFGYKDLKIKLVMSSASLQSYISYSYSSKVDPAKTEGVKADDVVEPLVKFLAPGSFTESKDEFTKHLTSTKETGFRPMGEMIHSFKSGEDETYEVYMCTESTPAFRDYHERLQFWIMFYIDAASYIDIDDEHWKIFLLFKKSGAAGGEHHYSVAGFITVYEYYAYGRTDNTGDEAHTHTNMKRPRISQMLILPPYQRKGLGSVLLNSVYRSYKNDVNVVDITVEDPADNFIRLRDYVDTQNCLKLEAFSKDKVLSGFSDAMVNEAAKQLKLCKKQARIVYEIIRLKHISMKDAESYKSYRVDVKRRLYAPCQNQMDKLKKMEKYLSPEELVAFIKENNLQTILDREQRLEFLNTQFSEVEAHYRKVLEKVAAA